MRKKQENKIAQVSKSKLNDNDLRDPQMSLVISTFLQMCFCPSFLVLCMTDNLAQLVDIHFCFL